MPGIPNLISLHFLVMLAFNLYHVSFPTLAVRTLDWEVRDTGASFPGSGGAVASVLGLVLGGVLYGYLEGGVFGLSSGLVLLVVLLSLRLPRAFVSPSKEGAW